MPNNSPCRTWPGGPWARWGATPCAQLADDPAGVTPELWDRLVSLGWTGHAGPRRRGRAARDVHRPRADGPGPAARARSSRRRSWPPWPPGPSEPTTCSPGWPPADSGGRWPCTSRGTATRWPRCGPGPGARASGWVVTGIKPIVVDGHTADWAIVVALAEEGIRSFLLPSPKAEAVPALDPDPQAGPLGARRGAGRAARARPAIRAALWRRVLDDVAVGLAAELVGVSDRALRGGGRVRQGAGGLRPTHRHVPGGQAPDRRHVPRAGDGPGRRALRRLGRRHRCARAVPGRRHGRRLRRRGRGAGDRRRHPDPRRGGVHLGQRRPLPLQAGQAERGADGWQRPPVAPVWPTSWSTSTEVWTGARSGRARPAMEFHLFLPQMRLSPEALEARALAAEASGFDGLALMDHLVPAGAPDQPMYEAFTTATWLAARHRSPPPRPPGAVRHLPASGGPGPSGGDPRPSLRWALRARDRLRLDPGRAGGLRFPEVTALPTARRRLARDPGAAHQVLDG